MNSRVNFVCDAQIIADWTSGWCNRHQHILRTLATETDVVVHLVGSREEIGLARSALDRIAGLSIEELQVAHRTTVSSFERLRGLQPASSIARVGDADLGHITDGDVWIALPWLANLGLTVAPHLRIVLLVEERWELTLMWGRLSRRLEHLAYARAYRRLEVNRCPRVVVISEDEATKFGEFFSYERVTVLPHFLDHRAPPSFPRGISGKVITIPGRTTLRLNGGEIKRILAAFDRRIRSLSGVRMVLASDDVPDQLLSASNDYDWLEVSAQDEDPVSTLERSDVCLVPSFHGSGSKTTVLEAMRAAVPVVGTSRAFSGITEWAGRQEANNIESLVEMTVAMILDPVRTERQGASGRRAFLDHHSLDGAERTLRHLLSSKG